MAVGRFPHQSHRLDSCNKSNVLRAGFGIRGSNRTGVPSKRSHQAGRLDLRRLHLGELDLDPELDFGQHAVEQRVAGAVLEA